jgi:hypothetical protein
LAKLNSPKITEINKGAFSMVIHLARRSLLAAIVVGLLLPRPGVAATAQWVGWDGSGSRCSAAAPSENGTTWQGWVISVEAMGRREQERPQSLVRIRAEFDGKLTKLREEHRALANRMGGAGGEDLTDADGGFAMQVYANSLAQARLKLELNAAIQTWEDKNIAFRKE